MAEHLRYEGDTVRSVVEVLEHFAQFDPADQDAHLENFEVFAGLYNDRSLVSDAILRDLEAMAAGRSPKMYSQQSIILGSEGYYSVRANLWSPIAPDRYLSKYELSSHSYHLAHDHNFNFLTVGYAGPGYRTKIYEYDRAGVEGYIGETVDMRHLRDVQLGERDVIYFRDGRDIHIQYEPEDYSVTVNLLISSENISEKAQYYFDVDRGCILDHVDSFVPKKVSMIQLASVFMDDEVADLMSRVIGNSQCAYTVTAALDAMTSRQVYRDAAVRAAEGLSAAQRSRIERIREHGGYSGLAFEQIAAR